MKAPSMLYLLQYLSWFSMPLGKERVIQSVLFHCKNKRKGLTKDEILEKGLNVFEKKEQSIYSLLEKAIELGLVVIDFSVERNEEQLQLTPKGLDALLHWYTDDYTDDYFTFEKEVKNLTDKYEEPGIHPLQIASLYWNGRTIGFVESIYFRENTLQKNTEDYHRYALKLLQKEYDEQHYILHIEPKLFLSREDMKKEVSLTIEGVDIEQSLIIGRPYRNKRYAVAGFKEGNQKLYTGFYPIIATKEELPKEIDIIYHWFIGQEKEVIHKLTIQFEWDKGCFFSTKQDLSRSHSLPTFEIRTMMEEDKEMFQRHRDFDITTNENGTIQIISEKVTLTSFPIHLHAFDYGNSSYESVSKKLNDN